MSAHPTSQEKTCDTSVVHRDESYSDIDAAVDARRQGELVTAINRLAPWCGPEQPNDMRKRAWLELAKVQLTAQRPRAAAVAFCKAARLDPLSTDAWAGVTVVAATLGRTALSRRGRRMLELSTPFASVREQALARAGLLMVPAVLLTQCRNERRKINGHARLQTLLSRAARSLQSHLDLNPNRADAYHHLSVVAHKAERPFVAQYANRQALRINPRYAAASAWAEQLPDAA